MREQDHNKVDATAKHFAASKLKRQNNTLYFLQMNVNEWLGDSRISLMKDYQFGWLMRLRMECWKYECRLPYDRQKLARLARASSIKRFVEEFDVLLEFFEPVEGGSMLEDPELRQLWDEKMVKVLKNRQSASIGGKQKYKQEPHAPIPVEGSPEDLHQQQFDSSAEHQMA